MISDCPHIPWTSISSKLLPFDMILIHYQRPVSWPSAALPISFLIIITY